MDHVRMELRDPLLIAWRARCGTSEIRPQRQRPCNKNHGEQAVFAGDVRLATATAGLNLIGFRPCFLVFSRQEALTDEGPKSDRLESGVEWGGHLRTGYVFVAVS